VHRPDQGDGRIKAAGAFGVAEEDEAGNQGGRRKKEREEKCRERATEHFAKGEPGPLRGVAPGDESP
jgi:hypothetical protein